MQTPLSLQHVTQQRLTKAARNVFTVKLGLNLERQYCRAVMWGCIIFLKLVVSRARSDEVIFSVLPSLQNIINATDEMVDTANKSLNS